jgi:hypothetical protein
LFPHLQQLREGRETGEDLTQRRGGWMKIALRKPLVEKLERFVKFKPQTPLREIIRLTAG